MDAYGWTRNNGELSVVWEAEENQTKAKERLDYVLNGCKCKTGCTTKQCKCQKLLRACGPGCRCTNCCNVHTQGSRGQLDQELHQLEVASQQTPWEMDEYADGSEDEVHTESEEEADQIMDFVFGTTESDTEDII